MVSYIRRFLLHPQSVEDEFFLTWYQNLRKRFFTAVLTKAHIFLVLSDHLHLAYGRYKSLRNFYNYLVIYVVSYFKIFVSSKPPGFTDQATTEQCVPWLRSNLVVGCKSASVEYIYEILVLPSGLVNSLSPNAWQNFFRKLIRESID